MAYDKTLSYAAKYLDEIRPNGDDSNCAEGTVSAVVETNNRQREEFAKVSVLDSSKYEFQQGLLDKSRCTEMRIPVPWGHIAAKTWGSPTGYPILGVHGWMDNAGTFDKLLPLLSKSFYFVSLDLPGHGFSSHYSKGVPYHYNDFVVAIRRVTNHFQWSKFSFIGHSMGAGLGAYYASVYPNDVDRVVLLDLTKPITSVEEGLAPKINMAIDYFLQMETKLTTDPPNYTYEEALDRLMKATDYGLTEEAGKALLVRGARRVDEDKYIFTRDIRLRAPSMFRISHEQIFSILKDIRCPVLLLKFKDAPWFERKILCDRAIEIYKEKCAFFQMEFIEGGHFIHLTEPEKVAGFINRFLLGPKSAL